MPIIAGSSTIPKWVLAQVTSSRNRRGLSAYILTTWFVLVSCINLFLLLLAVRLSDNWTWITYLFGWNLLYYVLPPLVLTFFGIWKLYICTNARSWLDQNRKWSELAKLGWRGTIYSPAETRFSVWIVGIFFLGSNVFLWWLCLKFIWHLS